MKLLLQEFITHGSQIYKTSSRIVAFIKTYQVANDEVCLVVRLHDKNIELCIQFTRDQAGTKSIACLRSYIC